MLLGGKMNDCDIKITFNNVEIKINCVWVQKMDGWMFVMDSKMDTNSFGIQKDFTV